MRIYDVVELDPGLALTSTQGSEELLMTVEYISAPSPQLSLSLTVNFTDNRLTYAKI